jgi:hypothetical protein
MPDMELHITHLERIANRLVVAMIAAAILAAGSVAALVYALLK